MISLYRKVMFELFELNIEKYIVVSSRIRKLDIEC